MRLSWKSSDGWSGDEEPHQCSLPGVPPDPGGHHHLICHAAHGDTLEAGADILLENPLTFVMNQRFQNDHNTWQIRPNIKIIREIP